MQPRWILPVSTLCAGIAFGFIAGKTTVHREKTSDVESIPVRARFSKPDRLSPESASAVRSLVAGGTSRGGGVLKDHSSLSSGELAREVAKLEHLSSGERAAETLLLFARWGEVDPLAAMAQARAYGAAGEAARCEVLKSWSNGDPHAAAEWFARHAGEFPAGQQGRSVSERGTASSVIARAWARQDPEAALAWAGSQGPEAGRSISAVLGETAVDNPALAIRLTRSADPSVVKLAHGEIAWQWASRDFPAAKRWIRTLPADQQDGPMAKAISSLAITDPEHAAQQLNSMPEGGDRERAVEIVVRHLAKEDTGAAERWLDSQASDTARRAGAISLVSAMAVENPARARGLLDSLEPGAARDGAAVAYIRSAPGGNPEELLELADSLANDADRGQSIAFVISRWKQEDMDAAERYIVENFGNAGAEQGGE